MPSYKRRTSSRRWKRRGSRAPVMPRAAAMIGKEIAHSLREDKVKTDLAHALKEGFLNDESYALMMKKHEANEIGNLYMRGFRGRGAYLGDLGAIAGGMVGGSLGAKMGGALGNLAGRRMGVSSGRSMAASKFDWAGRGAYVGNQLINPTGPSKKIAVSGDETNDLIFSHREYLQDITPTSNGFQTQYFQVINPGLAAAFPFLSQIAQYYEEYEFIQLIYEVQSMITDGNNNSAGNIIGCVQYNPMNIAFNSKQTMENYEHAISSKVTDHLFIGVECDPDKRSGSPAEYVRTGPVPSGQDAKTYDQAVVQIATNNATTGLNIGELWCHYKIRLSKCKVPMPGAQPGLPIVVAQAYTAGASSSYLNYLSLVNGVNTNFNVDSTNPLGVTVGGFYSFWNGSFTTIYFPQQIEVGNYEVKIAYSVVSGTLNGTPTVTVTNGALLSAGYGTVATAGTAGVITFIIVVAAPGTTRCSFVLTAVPWGTAPTNFSMGISQLNTSVSVGI